MQLHSSALFANRYDSGNSRKSLNNLETPIFKLMPKYSTVEWFNSLSNSSILFLLTCLKEKINTNPSATNKLCLKSAS